jgi:hypothetical protein
MGAIVDQLDAREATPDREPVAPADLADAEHRGARSPASRSEHEVQSIDDPETSADSLSV